MNLNLINSYLNKVRNQNGQIALETLIILMPWLVVAIMFFNLLFFLGSLMLTQSTVNRSALQIAAVGCIPDNLRSEIQSRAGLGIRNIQLRAVAQNPTPDGRPNFTWNRNRHIDSDGDIVANNGYNYSIPSCSVNPRTDRPDFVVPSGSYIFVQATYKQRLLVLAPLAALGMSDTVDVHRSALMVSSALEGEGR